MNKAKVLLEALPYIQKFHNKIFVIKYGGHAMIDENAKNYTAQDIVLLKYVGIKPVIVHGGGPEINRAMEKFGKKPEFIHGLRVTDEETLNIVEMVLTGKINGEIVSRIFKFGGKAVGLSGKSGRIILAKKKRKFIEKDGKKVEVDLGRVGETVEINTELLDILINNNYIPVISPIGIDEKGDAYNLNADTVAGDIASALKAEKLILITDVDGIMEDINDPSTVYKKLTVSDVKRLLKEGKIKGGMIPKVECAIKALESGGVKSVHIINGKIPHALLVEIFTEEGIGTMITKK
ncbi:acetylglutamate kinase [Methanocaldococcus villosus KIN24-T80]|uniref:Acetylglutamate kinase n=1 Tax=Methanocaldococcus villosus KIN24-T80 TaxID=1069083 RepID=N6VSW1_9EURY|nr:acetylglutamate kinase [Methanocaldococcus villosus]ENN96291.1 acetylglutamate kinase [Methanocaldococcus villosus KIN24-T80]